METNIGTNTVKFENQGGSLSEIQARISAMENPAPAIQSPVTPQANDRVQTLPQVPVIPAAEPIVEVPQQFKSPDGQLDEEKILKSNEHLRIGTEERKKKLIQLNKELREKFREAGTKVNEVEAESSFSDLLKGKITPEAKMKLAEELEKDPVEAMLKINRLIARQELEPHISKIQSMEKENLASREYSELDQLVEEGHDWIISEGLSRFEQAFNERPFLRQSPTPYKDAIRFIDTPGRQPTSAVGPKTPILGNSRAVPPPSSLAPVSPDQMLEELSQSLNSAMRQKNYALAAEIEKKMDAIYKSRF